MAEHLPECGHPWGLCICGPLRAYGQRVSIVEGHERGRAIEHAYADGFSEGRGVTLNVALKIVEDEVSHDVECRSNWPVPQPCDCGKQAAIDALRDAAIDIPGAWQSAERSIRDALVDDVLTAVAALQTFWDGANINRAETLEVIEAQRGELND